MSRDLAWPRLTMKLACFSEIWASRMRVPFNPTSSINFPAATRDGFLNTDPALGRFKGCLAILFWRNSSILDRIAWTVPGFQIEIYPPESPIPFSAPESGRRNSSSSLPFSSTIPFPVHQPQGLEAILHLSPKGPGIHEEGAPHRSRNSGGPFQPGEAFLAGELQELTQGLSGFNGDQTPLRAPLQFRDPPKSPGKRDRHAANPPIFYQEVRSIPEDEISHLLLAAPLQGLLQRFQVGRENQIIYRPPTPKEVYSDMGTE